MCPLRVAVSLFVLLGIAASAHADVITEWNTVWLDCVRATGGPPCPISRAGAMLHAAMVDAVNAVEQTHEPFLSDIHAPAQCPVEALAAQAGHDILVYLYPGRRALLDQELEAALNQVPDGQFKRIAIVIGRRIAQRVISYRGRDGSDNDAAYEAGTGPGEWRPTFPDYGAPATPNWGRVQPWTMTSGVQFRPVGPLGITDMDELLASPGYTAMYDEVKDLGARKSPSRTPYETDTAFFWANDVDGTYKPPGHLNHIAQVLSSDAGLSVAENARLFALLNIAIADAGISAWDCKYDTGIDFWRPIAGIREADTDGNPLTVPDPSWEPLNSFTPPFPAYISGHATFGATAAAIFRNYFGTDNVTHTISTDDPLYTGAPRTYHTFSEVALENGRSRIFLGVHWQFDADDGFIAGTSLGDYVYASILRPLGAAASPARKSDLALAVGRDGGGISAGSLRVASIPGRSETTIEYGVPMAGPVSIAVYDAAGRRVATLVNGDQPAGLQSIVWSGRSENGTRIPAGLYFARLVVPGAEHTRKLLILR